MLYFSSIICWQDLSFAHWITLAPLCHIMSTSGLCLINMCNLATLPHCINDSQLGPSPSLGGRNIWKCLETFLIVTNGDECYWCLVSRSQAATAVNSVEVVKLCSRIIVNLEIKYYGYSSFVPHKKYILAIIGPLYFRINFVTNWSVSTPKIQLKVLMWQLNYTLIWILTILSLLMYEHVIALHYLFPL